MEDQKYCEVRFKQLAAWALQTLMVKNDRSSAPCRNGRLWEKN